MLRDLILISSRIFLAVCYRVDVQTLNLGHFSAYQLLTVMYLCLTTEYQDDSKRQAGCDEYREPRNILSVVSRRMTSVQWQVQNMVKVVKNNYIRDNNVAHNALEVVDLHIHRIITPPPWPRASKVRVEHALKKLL